MSPQDDQKKRVPPRKSSSSMLLSTFAGLMRTSNKTVNKAPSLSATNSSASILANSFDDSSSSDHKRTEKDELELQANADADADADADAISQTNPVGHRIDVDAFSPELSELVVQLGSENRLLTRILAANKLSDYLEKYPVKEIILVWAIGSHLLRGSSVDASRAGFGLLISCIKAATPTTAEKSFFWASLVKQEGNENLGLRLDAAVQLSENGRNIECMEEQIALFLSQLLKMAYLAAITVRKQLQRNHGGPNSPQEQVLTQAFQFTSDVIKFNSVTLRDEDFKQIIHRLFSICNSTTTQMDLSSSMNAISQMATFTNISPQVFQPCLELLCGVYKQVSRLKEQAWTVFRRIFESNLKSAAVEHLFDILSGSSTKEITIQGAFYVLRDLMENDGKDGLPNISLPTFAPIVNKMLQRDANLRLETEVLKLYQTVLSRPTLRDRLFNDVDWMYFKDSLVHCSTVLQQTGSESNTDESRNAQSSPARKMSESARNEAIQLFHDIIEELNDAFDGLNVIHQEEAATLFFQLGSTLSDKAAGTLFQYLASRPLLTSRPIDDYQKIWKYLIINFAHPTSRPTSLRAKTYEHLCNRFDQVQYFPPDVVKDFVMILLQNFGKESDSTILEILAVFVAKVLNSKQRDTLFDPVMAKVREAIFSKHHTVSRDPISRRPSTSPIVVNKSNQPTLCRIVVRHIIRVFLALMNESAHHAEQMYNLIQTVAGDNDLEPDARICALKLLFRLRSTGDNRIYVAPISESETIAAVLCRTLETATLSYHDEQQEGQKEMRNASTGTVQLTKAKSMSVKKPVLPLWFYPGPKGLPQEPSETPSLVMYSATPLLPDPRKKAVIKISLWLETVISILQQPNVDWEIYSYVLVHLGAQLKNQSLFAQATPQIQFLRSVLCEQIRAQNFHDPPSYTSLRKADVAICIFHVLTMLVSYNAHFAKSEDDDIVKSFILGIGSWDGTSKWCIHALSICCHELPLSVSRLLDGILQKMSQIITYPSIAIHILEFLCSLARLPDLWKNFREDDFKMVFGVSFRYLQYVRDQRQMEEEKVKRASLPSAKAKRHSDSMRELKHQVTESDLRAKDRSNDLPQYVYALAYHVITFWFMALKLHDRPLYIPWIAKNLMYTDNAGNEVVEDQGLVTLDMMERVAYTDRDETTEQTDFARPTDGEVSEKTWVVGMSLLTIQTAGRTGTSQIIRRRPSGTKYLIYRPLLTRPPRHQVPVTTGLEADVFYTSSYIGVLPEDVLQDMYSGLSLATAPKPLSERPFPLPTDDERVKRALATFDRNATVDGHKIGVIYIGERQTKEAEILANTYGSAAYTDFISQLGTLVRLKGATFNTQGLDRSDDSDGKYVYCWRDRATEVVFHTTTMMPTDKENDPNCIKKKSHIGNDFVNIVWNDSGGDFNFDTFPSQFNYVYIIITPEIRSSFVAQRQQPDDPQQHTQLDPAQSAPPTDTATKSSPPSQASPLTKLTYKLHVLSAPSFPTLSPCAEPKVVSARTLAPLARLLALNASFFSLVWANREAGGEAVSPWRNRLREIQMLRDKYLVKQQRESGLGTPLGSAGGGLLAPLGRVSQRGSFLGGLGGEY